MTDDIHLPDQLVFTEVMEGVRGEMGTDSWAAMCDDLALPVEADGYVVVLAMAVDGLDRFSLIAPLAHRLAARAAIGSRDPVVGATFTHVRRGWPRGAILD